MNQKPNKPQETCLSKTVVSGSFSSDEVKWLLYYGQSARNSDIRIDDDDRRLDWAFESMFDLLEEQTHFSRKQVEALFWKRVEALANYR